MTMILLRAPAGVTGVVKAGGTTYPIDSNGNVSVDASLVATLLDSGYTYPTKKITYITSSTVSPGPNVDLTADLVYVTTSGSGGVEYVNVPEPQNDAQGYGDASLLNHMMSVIVQTLTNAGDAVHVYRKGGATFSGLAYVTVNNFVNLYVHPYTTVGVVLDSVGYCAPFLCAYDTCYWMPNYSDAADNTPFPNPPISTVVKGLNSGTTGVAGGAYEVHGGAATVGDANGGDAVIAPGAGHGTGTPGKLIMNNTVNAAAAAAGTLTNAPTAGNPTRWIRVTIDGVAMAIPAWPA